MPLPLATESCMQSLSLPSPECAPCLKQQCVRKSLVAVGLWMESCQAQGAMGKLHHVRWLYLEIVLPFMTC